jgi:hypothetical protein
MEAGRRLLVRSRACRRKAVAAGQHTYMQHHPLTVMGLAVHLGLPPLTSAARRWH